MDQKLNDKEFAMAEDDYNQRFVRWQNKSIDQLIRRQE